MTGSDLLLCGFLTSHPLAISQRCSDLHSWSCHHITFSCHVRETTYQTGPRWSASLRCDDASSPPDFDPDSKHSDDDEKHDLEPVQSSSSGGSSSGIVPQATIIALDDDPPRYATLTIHSWKTLRFVNFPHSVLEAVDGVAKLFYLKGIKWEFEHEQWGLVTGAIACKFPEDLVVLQRGSD